MTWQPPQPPRPGSGGQGGQRPGGQPGGGGGQGGQRPGGQPAGGGAGHQGAREAQPAPNTHGLRQGDAKAFASMNFYELLQVNRDAHPTIIRYAYRFLAAMYHPDNTETGDSDKFRIVTEAWRTLSDDGKRAAYDMSLGALDVQAGRPATAAPQQKVDRGLPKFQKVGISWTEVELRLAILQILLDQRKKKPKTGGASAKLIMDVLDLKDVEEVEFALWYLREKNLIEMGERLFMITAVGVDYIVDILSKPTTMGESEIEKKVNRVVDGGVPATIPR